MTDTKLLVGYKAIARFLGLTPRQVSCHAEQGHLPTFLIGHSVCAREARLVQWIEDLERAGNG